MSSTEIALPIREESADLEEDSGVIESVETREFELPDILNGVKLPTKFVKLIITKDKKLIQEQLEAFCSSKTAQDLIKEIRSLLETHYKYTRAFALLNSRLAEMMKLTQPTLSEMREAERVMYHQKEVVFALRDCAECFKCAVSQLTTCEINIFEVHQKRSKKPVVEPEPVEASTPEKPPTRGRGRQKESATPQNAKPIVTPVTVTTIRPERATLKDKTPAPVKAPPTVEENETPVAPPPKIVKSRRAAKIAAAAELSSTSTGTGEKSEVIEKRPKRETTSQVRKTQQRTSNRLGGKTPRSTSAAVKKEKLEKEQQEQVVKEKEPREEEPTYCTCSRVSFGEMIGCDNTDCVIEWFHFECVELKTKPKGKWFCPECRHPDNAKLPKPKDLTKDA